MKKRGDVTAVVLIVLSLIGGGLFVLRPKWLHGDSRRAEHSQQATQKVEAATAKTDAAAEKQAATAAASVAKIGEAAATAPASPEKDFIVREVPVALASLPAPDPVALLAAEKRRVAVMEGRLEEVARLYGEAMKQADKLREERDAAKAERDRARAERMAVDRELAETAAARLAGERRQAVLIVVAVVLLGLWAYAKLFSIGPGTLGKIAADIRADVDPIQAMDTHLTPWLHPKVRKAAQLATDPDAPKAPSPS